MSADRDTTRIVLSWLRADEHVSADRLLSGLLIAVDATPQRRPSWPALRTLTVNRIVRVGLAAAAVLLVTVIRIQLIGPGTFGAPSPATPTPSIAAPSAGATTLPLPSVSGSELTAGTTYYLPDFPVGVAFTASERMRACAESRVEQGICFYPYGYSVGQLGFLVVTNVAVNPCSPGEVFPDPPVGPSVEDLVTAISSLDGFRVTAPVGVFVDGFSGKRMTVSAPQESSCPAFALWATADRVVGGMLPGHSLDTRIIDVDGARIVITFPEPNSPYAPVFDSLVSTVRIEP